MANALSVVPLLTLALVLALTLTLALVLGGRKSPI
jgi:hypothetical protein